MRCIHRPFSRSLYIHSGRVFGSQPRPSGWPTTSPSVVACAISIGRSLARRGHAHALVPWRTSAAILPQQEHQQPLRTPPLPERNNAASWAKLCEPFLPTNLRRKQEHTVETSSLESPSLRDLFRIISAARDDHGIDIIAYLGLKEERWNAALWISRTLINDSPNPISAITRIDRLSNLEWTTVASLGESTRTTLALSYDPFERKLQQHPLTEYTSAKESASRIRSSIRGSVALGHVWQTIGNLLLAACEHENQSRGKIMSCVLQIMAHLHHVGWIPESVYQFNDGDSAALQQPPLLPQLASVLLSSLSDAVYQDNAGNVIGASQVTGFASAFSLGARSKHEGIQPGPEIWMEFALWCCIHGPWTIDGASIIEAMTEASPAKPWSATYWGEMVGMLENKSARSQQNRLRLSDNFGIGRTISAEVVEALIDGLINNLIQGEAVSGRYTLATVVQKLTVLKSLLDRANLSLGYATWTAKIARFADLPDFEVERNPQILEAALELAETYSASKDTPEAQIQRSPRANLPGYVFDASAAVLGLYHRTLHAYIRLRDVNGALRLLSRLQSMTDKSKSDSLTEFFAELKTISDTPFRKVTQEGTELPINFDSIFPGVEYPGFYPDIPVAILADLLDMINEAGAIEIGKWMIHSKDIDGPLIGENLYGHQLMAPALIRFAATTKDTELLIKLTRAQSTSISAKTLIALCDSKIRDGDMQGAAEILALIRDHSLYGWTTVDFATLLRPLIIASSIHEQDDEATMKSSQASALMQRLLRGDLGQVWGPLFSQLDTITGIISSMSPSLASTCSGLLQIGASYKVDLDTESFSTIMQGAVEAFGSTKGRALWEMWCLGSNDHRKIPSSTATFHKAHVVAGTPRERFFGKTDNTDAESLESENDSTQSMHVTFNGCIQPQLETIRIIVQQALAEQRRAAAANETPPTPLPRVPGSPRSNQTTQSFTRHEVLDWAAEILRLDFSMSSSDIDYKLQGYITSQNISLPQDASYSPQTLQIWRAFTGSRHQWALAQEERLRLFVENSEEKQVVFEYVPAAERFLLHCLAGDYGLVSESFGEDIERAVNISKTVGVMKVPKRTVEEVVRRFDRR